MNMLEVLGDLGKENAKMLASIIGGEYCHSLSGDIHRLDPNGLIVIAK